MEYEDEAQIQYLTLKITMTWMIWWIGEWRLQTFSFLRKKAEGFSCYFRWVKRCQLISWIVACWVSTRDIKPDKVWTSLWPSLRLTKIWILKIWQRIHLTHELAQMCQMNFSHDSEKYHRNQDDEVSISRAAKEESKEQADKETENRKEHLYLLYPLHLCKPCWLKLLLRKNG